MSERKKKTRVWGGESARRERRQAELRRWVKAPAAEAASVTMEFG